jgi:hypothetical protein
MRFYLILQDILQFQPYVSYSVHVDCCVVISLLNIQVFSLSSQALVPIHEMVR